MFPNFMCYNTSSKASFTGTITPYDSFLHFLQNKCTYLKLHSVIIDLYKALTFKIQEIIPLSSDQFSTVPNSILGFFLNQYWSKIYLVT